MRLSHISILALFTILVFPLGAQVEPQLKTKTDLADVYKSTAGQPTFVALYDITPASRAIFEPYDYLTNARRQAYSNAASDKVGGGDSGVGQKVFDAINPVGADDIAEKNLGAVFGLRKLAAVDATTGTDLEIRLYRWPSTIKVMTDPEGNVIKGIPIQHKTDGTTQVIVWDTDPKTTIPKITHVRTTVIWKVKVGNATTTYTRTIDLPCPSLLFDAPTAISNPKHQAYSKKEATATDGTKILYDPWSKKKVETEKADYPTITNPDDSIVDFIVGNFHYGFDYLAWIFGGTSVRSDLDLKSSDVTPSTTWVSAASYYKNSGFTNIDFAIPGVSDDCSLVLRKIVEGVTTIELLSGEAKLDRKGVGFFNGLPVMTRYQATKVATIEVLLKFDAGIIWKYRFLDPAYHNGPSAEELQGTSTQKAGQANNSDVNGTTKFGLRQLTVPALKTEGTSLQNLGPEITDAYDTNQPYTVANSKLAPNNWLPAKKGPEAETPYPVSYALANTYRQVLAQASTSDCAGESIVMVFPTRMSNDSTAKALDLGAEAAYVGLIGGTIGADSFSALSSKGVVDQTSADIGKAGFHPASLGAIAAHSNDKENNSDYWKAPWKLDTSASPKRIQTMVLSVGVPGAFGHKDESSQPSSPHTHYFKLAQWSDPNRKINEVAHTWDSKYDTPILYPIKTVAKKTTRPAVNYFIGTDPSSVVENLEEAIGAIVSGRAALSAPATPATGVRATTQAFFGIFKTSTTPLWTGNMLAVGIQRVNTGTAETFSFYGRTGTGFVPTDNDGTNNFDKYHLWSAFDIFGAFDTTTAEYKALVYPPTTTGLLGTPGTPLKWSDRVVYSMVDNVREDYKTTNNKVVEDVALKITGKAKTADLTDAEKDDAKKLIRWVRGAADETSDTGEFNRLSIMGDIINSAPLALELAKSTLDKLDTSSPNGVAKALVAQHEAFTATDSGYTDPHARLIIVGTNTGQLHCFAEASAKDANDFYPAYASELWAFIPPNVHKALWNLYLTKDKDSVITKNPHLYLIDGDPILYHKDVPTGGKGVADTRVGDGENAVVTFGMRKGARSYYALQISGVADETAIYPDKPLFAWSIDPPSSTDEEIQSMGMSSAIPSVGEVLTGTAAAPVRQPALFLSGGYSNAEMDTAFKTLGQELYDADTTDPKSPKRYQDGMGKLVLALDPLGTGKGGLKELARWGTTSGLAKLPAGVGAITEGITPSSIFTSTGLLQRLYFADTNGNIYAINSNQSADNTAFRKDSSFLSDWKSIRTIFSDSTLRFTTRPDAARVVGDYPFPETVKNVADKDVEVRPLTVAVAIGSGDRNNPTDASEYNAAKAEVAPPTTNKMLVLFDRQNHASVGSLAQIQEEKTKWPDCYAEDAVTITHDDYFLRTTPGGYYWLLRTGALDTAFDKITHDKVLVSPLIKEGGVFFSIFNIRNSSGSQCSANSFTRTFRNCDILRPLRIDTQVDAKTTVGNVNELTKNADICTNPDSPCTGLAFYFNSLSSQLVDAGDRVIQGGARSEQAVDTFDKQSGQNTPDIRAVKNTSRKSGFRLRAWRVVR